MRRNSLLLMLLLCISSAPAQSPAQQSFDTLKTLAGEWSGKDNLGHPVQVTFRVVSGGTALLNEIVASYPADPSMKEDMISMVHLDGSRLLLTHYCGAGNQPRLAGKAANDGKTFTFDFVDGTNLSSKTGYMSRVVLNILGPDRHREEWWFVKNGKEEKSAFDLQRPAKAGELL
ncbi:MAG TPA: hypothetical protein VKW06_20140 [Candidatus Angelobacter sp.]|nr:hypothetical protein [Candidatus Angelobacter sp.]